MQMIDNINKTVKDDLQAGIHKGSKISVAAACFSIYAYQELKKQLENIDELRFIFTSPTFVTEKTPKTQREFYIPRISRESSLYGTEFEVKLRNELTQKAIAKECADWIRRKVVFKSNVTQEQMMGFMTVDESTYMPINGFTTVDLGCERGNNAYYPVQKTESFENANYFLKLFEQLWNDKKKLQDVTDIVIENISAAYRENAPEYIYFVALYNIFKEFLDDLTEDELPNEATGFKESKIWGMLYNFQRDAVLAIISKLEKYNGCILADSVGLGKTFTALAIIKYYENRNKSVLVLCPKKLSENWNTYKGNYINNPIAADRLRYDVLYHTDLSRQHGQSNGIDLDRLNWGNYDLVVIDESHNFRNGGEVSGEDAKENRYLKLLNKVVRAGVKTKVLMLSATPIPRTLAMSYLADIDVSVIDELPPGRQEISTKLVSMSRKGDLVEWIGKSLAAGLQAYWVCPLIEESEKVDLTAATETCEEIKQILPQFKIELLHGKMTPEDKNAVMDRFVKGETKLLVSTTVIEVGVDVPNASIMVIEHAERFGLAQLHQLRGRVGRGKYQSYCIFMTASRSKETKERLEILNHSNDGFYIANEDLRLRGPGDLFGIRQSGVLDFKIADVFQDAALLQEANAAAERLLLEDPDLSQEQHRKLKDHLQKKLKDLMLETTL